jgi:hypothetical protein
MWVTPLAFLFFGSGHCSCLPVPVPGSSPPAERCGPRGRRAHQVRGLAPGFCMSFAMHKTLHCICRAWLRRMPEDVVGPCHVRCLHDVRPMRWLQFMLLSQQSYNVACSHRIQYATAASWHGVLLWLCNACTHMPCWHIHQRSAPTTFAHGSLHVCMRLPLPSASYLTSSPMAV